jgi:hypothetical protein
VRLPRDFFQSQRDKGWLMMLDRVTL